MTKLQRLWEEQGQSPWLDNLRRDWIHDGTLQSWIDRGVRGVTSNPSIFQKAMTAGDAYDAQLQELVKGGATVDDAYWTMVERDIRDALALLRPVHDASGGVDGYVSLELAPEMARDTESNPALQPIADRAQDVADQELKKSEAALHEAGAEKQPPAQRYRQFGKADKQLGSAVRRLEELKRDNDKLAQQRLDQAKLEQLADRQKQLAEKATELAAKDPVRDPSAKNEAEQLKREQQDVANELQRLTEQSEAIKNALDQARVGATVGGEVLRRGGEAGLQVLVGEALDSNIGVGKADVLTGVNDLASQQHGDEHALARANIDHIATVEEGL